MAMRPLFQHAIGALIAASLASPGLAASRDDIVRGDKDIFSGCTSAVSQAVESGNPRDRINQRNEARVDKVTQRQFASFTMDDIEAGAADDLPPGCWASLAGVWKDKTGYTLDRRIDNPDIWGSTSREALALTNGTYTTPRYVVVVESRDPESSLFLSTGLKGDRFVRFRSRDNVPFEAVFARGGERKVYSADGQFAYGDRLVVDVTATGKVRMRIGDLDFERPDLGVSQEQLDAQLSQDDVFLIGVQIQNLAASRKGYDIVTQDPFLLNDNNKGEVFARPGDKQYVIDEQRLVPIGYKLVMDGTSGMVFRKSALSSSTEIQTTLSHTLGGSIHGEGNAGKFANAAVAGSATQTSVESMSRRSSIAQAIGYSRSKRMAIIVDHPYIGLSDEFIDAVEDARRYGEYDRLISRFGTHNPYAVTYGAAARLSQSFTEEQYIQKAINEWGYDGSIEAEAGVKDGQGNKIFAAGFSANFGFLGSESLSNGAEYSSDNSEFFGVGGNGSWNENGWMAGDVPYPILLDLRPIWELLNPMNFPGEPEIYDVVRHRLEQATVDYLNANGRPVAEELPGLPGAEAFQAAMPKPEEKEPIHEYFVYVRHFWCTGAASGRAKSVQATYLKISEVGALDQPNETIKTSGMKVECKAYKPPSKTVSYNRGDPGFLVIRGTERELKAKAFQLEMTWDYNPGSKQRQNSKMYAGRLAGLKVGEREDQVWTVHGVALPEYKLRVRVKRRR